MSWDLWAVVIVVALAGAVLIAVPLWQCLTRAVGWYRVRQFRQCYVPSSSSCKPWRQNAWRVR